MRLRVILPALAASLAFHAGVAAWLLPADLQPEVAGGEQATVLEIGTDTFNALMAGIETLEAERSDVVQPDALDAHNIEETAAELIEPRKTEVQPAVQAHRISEPAESVVAQNAPQDPASTKITASSAVQVVEVGQSEILASVDPVREITAEPATSSLTPVPQKPEVETEKRPEKTGQDTIPIPKPKPKIAKPAPAKKKAATKSRKTVSRRKTKTRPAARSKGGSGGESTATAKRGSSASRTATGSRSKGNASVSNYPGRVYARISRTRRKSAGARGTARVSFRITSAGRLASIRLARSSGNSRVDSAAIAHIRRSAPFPKPPAGAKRSFVIPIEFRR